MPAYGSKADTADQAKLLEELATPGGFEPPTLSLEVVAAFNDFKVHSDKFLLRTWLEATFLFLFVGMTSASIARSGQVSLGDQCLLSA
jgi:hypothetical protein